MLILGLKGIICNITQFYTQFLSYDMYRSMPSLKVLTKNKEVKNNRK